MSNSTSFYRDLKSENVLVWRFPPPSEFSGRSARKPSPRNVLIKLGDYGISRFSHPFGMCKGYGGTEGFMAPEIMRYNGEQEYSEKADCFSFGMFIYELLTLKQPYEGQPVQQMKERILEAQRPAVGEKELLYGTNMLDLMIACWEERAERRPSSMFCSRVFSPFGRCAAPRRRKWVPLFGHAVKFRRRLKLCQECTLASKPVKQNNFHRPKTTNFSTTAAKPTEEEHYGAQITVIAQIYDEFVWTGDELGTLSIFEQDEHQLLMANSSAPLYKIDTIEMLEESSQSKTEKTFVHPPLSRLITITSSLSSSSSAARPHRRLPRASAGHCRTHCGGAFVPLARAGKCAATHLLHPSKFNSVPRCF
ncbi:hypothetical protein niasHT_038291 [Heterodera trifolii]|uniref:Protein kinase domain-containing protein n=1 Tax=Heterodera trifolii TaxID=157864 RepID=A0ABD2HPS3_9BILA